MAVASGRIAVAPAARVVMETVRLALVNDGFMAGECLMQ